MREIALTHEFVEHIPDDLRDGVIYISTAFATVAHKCCCGCGSEVITPLSPTDWKLIYDGESISLEPSVGNWSLPCQSHYWIIRDRVKWAPRWSQAEINAGRAYDALAKERYFATPTAEANSGDGNAEEGKSNESLWQRLKKWLSGKTIGK